MSGKLTEVFDPAMWRPHVASIPRRWYLGVVMTSLFIAGLELTVLTSLVFIVQSFIEPDGGRIAAILSRFGFSASAAATYGGTLLAGVLSAVLLKAAIWRLHCHLATTIQTRLVVS